MVQYISRYRHRLLEVAVIARQAAKTRRLQSAAGQPRPKQSSQQSSSGERGGIVIHRSRCCAIALVLCRQTTATKFSTNFGANKATTGDGSSSPRAFWLDPEFLRPLATENRRIAIEVSWVAQRNYAATDRQTDTLQQQRQGHRFPPNFTRRKIVPTGQKFHLVASQRTVSATLVPTATACTKRNAS
jgi:hypothetical protein